MSQTKKLAVLLVATFVALALTVVSAPDQLNATPGGLDRYGGHHCWTDCASYGKYTGQYHCHRKTARCRRNLRRHRAHGH